MKVIEIEHLTKKYHRKTAIDNVSLSVEEGEIYGFIGPNGAGKSTTIKALLDFIRPTKGSAKIFGMDVHRKAKKIRKKVGYVSSDVRFYDGFTSLEILKYVAEYHKLTDRERSIDFLIELFQIDPKKKMQDLSLGNKKKIALAAGLLPDPKLLILDEPTNGLDPLMQHRLFAELERRNEQGMTIFLSSHDLNEIQEHAHRAAFIREGKLVTVQDIHAEQSLGKVVTVKGQKLENLFAAKDFTLLKNWQNKRRYLYTGDLKALLLILEHPEITDFTIETPDLEDQFMALYEGGTQDDHL